jgi:YidC/Oxa1 family membrane protein insertase
VDAIVNAFHVFRDALYMVLKFYQHLVEPILGSQSYWFAIVLLTLSVRIILIPLTVKQVRASRAMSDMAPEIKKLQAKHKNDREKLNQEMMALYKERGANPLAGCLPLLAQAPFFFALYHVIFQVRIAGETNILRDATFFGVPLQQHWMQLAGWDKVFSLSGIVILVLILTMSATTYISQRQLLARQAEVNPQQAMIMKVMPLMFLFFSINFPLAVIIYWVTTNLWSMGQQYLLLKDRPKVAAAGAAGATGGGSSGPSDKGGGGTKPGGGRNGAKAGSADGDAKPRGFFGSMRAAISQAQELAGARGNGSPDAARTAGTKQQPKNRSGGQNATAGRSKSSSNGNPPGGSRSTSKRGTPSAARGATEAGDTADVTKGSTAGRKPASPPRSGGGKSGRSNQQRRRKR